MEKVLESHKKRYKTYDSELSFNTEDSTLHRKEPVNLLLNCTKEEKRNESMNKKGIGSVSFKAISRDQWSKLMSSGQINIPVGAHNPKYTMLQP